MSLDANKAVITTFLKHLSNWDLDKVFAMMNEDATWWVAGKPEHFPIAGTKSKSEMQAILQSMGSQLKSPAQITVHGMVAEGNKVAVEAESRAEAANGRHYNNQYHFLVELKDGKVQTFKEYNDTLHVKATFMDP